MGDRPRPARPRSPRTPRGCDRPVPDRTPPRAALVSVTGLPKPSPTVPAAHVRAAVGARVGQATSNRGRHVIVTGDHPRTVDDQAEQLLTRITVDEEKVS
ncbi:hypothetical protein [Streptomyces sp. NPDC102487]|uniref:hypothetical protein n=1 Tax=Streptomyces sp. NPDC102487 TaxID=3366182 RepID=UPI00382E8DD1